jgi:hypothetical protein
MRIKVAVTGDEWSNREEVLANLQQIHSCDQLIFEVNTEGPSLHALGFVDAVEAVLDRIGIKNQDVYIDQWHNPVEEIPFKRFREPGLSHFFWMSNSYRFQPADQRPMTHAFGLFIGRVTADRAVILFDVCHDPILNALTSLMKDSVLPMNSQEKLLPWSDFAVPQQVQDWIINNAPPSITGHEVRDQYSPNINTNAELVKHYNRFGLEIVCETYCIGDAFFPTEKTVRPISQNKAMVVYGPKGYLGRLRQLGFQTWHDIWDETYDEFSGPERWHRMKQVLRDIANKHLWQHDQVLARARDNVQVLEQLIQRYQPQ